MVMQFFGDLFNSAIDLLFSYEVADRHTEPILEVLADLKNVLNEKEVIIECDSEWNKDDKRVTLLHLCRCLSPFPP